MRLHAILFMFITYLNACKAFSPVIYTSTINKANNFNYNLYSSYDSNEENPNKWISQDDTYENVSDWEETMSARQDGSLWSSFESSKEGEEDTSSESKSEEPMLDDGEAWLDTLASISASEIEFNMRENERADKARQMQEWGFESETIENSLGLVQDERNEIDEENVVYEKFKEETAKTGFGMYIDDEVDLETVESHTTVGRDEETGELIRTQMVYVDEHSCIGCTHCAMVAQSTFFMEPELGRARVFQQWGDDQETIEIAIETCPVDCIHYVPYDELERLEIDRRDQNINFKARLVSQGEYGGSTSHMVGGSTGFTAPQKISGNMGSRCNNCPSRGCADCPMYGVGKNPYFEKKEKERKERAAKRKLKQQMEDQNRSADL